MDPESIQWLTSYAIGTVIVICFIALLVTVAIGIRRSAGSEQRHKDCLKANVPEDGDQSVCLGDEYAASQARVYMGPQDDDCPPCYCKIHGTNCPDIFRRLRALAIQFKEQHSGARDGEKKVTYNDGYEDALWEAGVQLQKLIVELGGKPEEKDG